MDDQEFDLRRVLGILRRQWRLIAVTFVLVLGLAALGIFALQPAYTASVLMLVDPSSKNLLNPTADMTNATSESARVDSEVQIITAETTLLKVIQEAKLLDDPEFGIQVGMREKLMTLLRLSQPTVPTAEDKRDAALAKLRQSIKVFRNGLTYLITISATADDPESAAIIANIMAKQYIRAQVESKISSIQSSRDIIQDQVTEASDSVVKSEEALDDFITSSVDRIVAETGRTDLAQMEAELKEASRTKLELSATADTAEKGIAAGDWTTVVSTLKSDTLAKLADRQTELQRQLDQAANGTQAEFDIRAQLAAVVTDLGTGAKVELSKLKDEIASTQAKAADLQVQLRSAMLSSDLPPSILANIYELQQTAELARSQYQTLLTRLKDLQAQSFLQVADTRVVSDATIPEDPSFPDTRLLLAVSGILALGLGMGFAFLRENYIGGFSSDVQLASVLKAPVAAAIPRPRQGKERGATPIKTGSLADLLVSAPFSHYAEAVRRLQVGVDQAIRRGYGGRQRGSGAVVMVTSANANEGKTTLALSLTRAYALSGRKTILVDCDLRKPSVHSQLALPPSPKLTEYLGDIRGELELDEIVIGDPMSQAKIVLGSRRGEMLGGKVITGEFFERLIDAARANFDIVILDTPPVGAVVDALHLAQYADVIVAVTRYASTSQQDARAANNAITDAKRDEVEILAVLSAVEQSRSSNRKKYGGYYTD